MSSPENPGRFRYVPPAEYEQQYYRSQDTPAMVAGVN